MKEQELTDKQKKILDFIIEHIKSYGSAPTIREIMKQFNFSSTGTVRDYLKLLAKKKFIRISPNIARGIELLTRVTGIPVIGRIRAGRPDIPVEDVEDYVDLCKLFPKTKDIFILRVKGDSMSGSGIIDNDLIIVHKQPTAKSGDIVVALVDNEVTVKQFYQEKNYIRLEPSNPRYKPITICTKKYGNEPIQEINFSIIGKVIGLIRNYRV
jgi:repressor LexA